MYCNADRRRYNTMQAQLFKRRPDGDVEVPVRRPDGDVELQDAGMHTNSCCYTHTDYIWHRD